MDRRYFIERIGISIASFAIGATVGREWLGRFPRRDAINRATESQSSTGGEPWESVVRTAVKQLLARTENHGKLASSVDELPKKRLAFPCIDNRSSEEIGDFGDEIYQKIDSIVHDSQTFELVNIGAVKAGLRQAGLQPDDLYIPSASRKFAEVMERERESIDYLLFATITDGTVKRNQTYQRDKLLTLELMEIETAQIDKESLALRKNGS